MRRVVAALAVVLLVGAALVASGVITLSVSPPRTDEVSASGTAEALGLSRVTARRYLEHFVDAGLAEVRLQYGGTGRPERRYRARG